ncbi:adhesin biosynthesis transcription regulatory family protein [Escherichia albertii]|uniref:adhesin biosynthesis transcription regulatory family protein n=1 Tax=Escherichia albertii TaxID=208962 RepID=UPI00235124FA|nr:adhesin biosynthesis transcription regulatory family protein [Escherichia albertii]MCZ8596345.1 adhesin biosynthesis transcription regulatory family protein [Escherichia albertii]MCZ8777102.1 adhesin biosynthesis transcription regulatory family protein [Escherichia albertii]MCZ8825350.1 adhesin biosynthesis transcription regulatory family protein [Escherichia albertii]MCZ8876633.1 adhesin biosynthesis transcription regulatory family protein [Escherichia albertii]MCZ8993659.1 adhesin biosynt
MSLYNMYNENSSSMNATFNLMIKKGGVLPGSIDEDHFWLLMEILPFHSKKIINAMRDHLVSGLSRKEVCKKYGVNNGYLSISISRLNYAHNIIRHMIHYYNAAPQLN